MSLYQNYVFIAACLTMYTLGQMHARGHGGWKNLAMAMVTGAAWPVAVAYGIYAVHFAARTGEGE